MRLPRLRPSALSAEQAAVYRAITSGPRSAGPQMFRLRDSDGCLEGPFNLMLYSPAAGLALQDLGAAIRYSSVLPARVRELAILTVASKLRCEFEWYAHHRLAQAAGVPADLIDALRQNRVPGRAGETDQSVVAVVRAALADGRLGDEAYEAAVAAFGPRGLVELVLLTGYYSALAKAMAVFEVGLPAGETPAWNDPAR